MVAKPDRSVLLWEYLRIARRPAGGFVQTVSFRTILTDRGDENDRSRSSSLLLIRTAFEMALAV
jgi:hypothetical protein